MNSEQIRILLTKGYVEFWNQPNHKIRVGVLSEHHKEFTETELNKMIEDGAMSSLESLDQQS